VAFRRMIGKRDHVWIMKTPPFSGRITLPGLLCLGMTGRGGGDAAVSPPGNGTRLLPASQDSRAPSRSRTRQGLQFRGGAHSIS
jgi:hypothetical protein